MNPHGLRSGHGNLEHRCGKRKPLSLDVVIRGRDGLPLQGRMSDISRDGMFIRLGSHTVSPSTMVEIEVSHCGCLRGWVVHTGDEGVGIMFCLLGSREKQVLELLLSSVSEAWA